MLGEEPHANAITCYYYTIWLIRCNNMFYQLVIKI